MTGAEPTWTPWSAAYVYASVMGDLVAERDARQDPDPDPDDTFPGDYNAAKILLARAITIGADLNGVTVTSPEDLGRLSLVDLHTVRLNRLKAIVEFADPDLGNTPMPDEPGFDTFTRLWQVVQARGATVADHVADEAVRARTHADLDEHWTPNLELAQGAVLVTVQTVCTDLRAPAPLRLLSDRLPQHEQPSTS